MSGPDARPIAPSDPGEPAMSRTALLAIDIQNDFCEGGALAVEGGNAVAAAVADYLGRVDYDLRIASLDWHAPAPDTNCGHFALDGDPDYSTSWPVHCVAATDGASLHPALDADAFDVIVRKGYGTQSYSAFEGASAAGTTLLAVLRSAGVTHIDVVGLATDYCVRQTVLDALGLGFAVRVLLGQCAGVAPLTTNRAIHDMLVAGANIVGAVERAVLV